MAYTRRKFAKRVLKRLGDRPSDGAVQGLIGWERAEGGHFNNTARYNPLNTTQPAPGAGNTGTQGNIKVYRSPGQGVRATVKTLENGNYGGILRALKAGDPSRLASAIDASPWGTHGSLVYNAINSAPKHAGGPVAGGTYGSAPGRGSRTTTTTSGPSDSARAAALIQYLNERDSPDALLNLAVSLHGTAATTTATTKTPADKRAPHRNTIRLGASPPPKELRHLAGTTNFEGHTVAAWIAPVLKYARAHGWTGSVASGYRSYGEQKRIYDSGVRPAAVPGTSNHEGSRFPRGAVDVNGAQQLATILLRSPYAHLLQYAGAKDAVHFSHPHDGGY